MTEYVFYFILFTIPSTSLQSDIVVVIFLFYYNGGLLKSCTVKLLIVFGKSCHVLNKCSPDQTELTFSLMLFENVSSHPIILRTRLEA